MRAMPDGGTLEVVLVGADGERLAVRRTGDIMTERSNQKLDVIKFLWFVPFACEAPKGSHLEAEAQEALESWLSSSLPVDQQSRLSQNDPEAIRSAPFDVIVAYELMSWIEKRH